MNRSYYPPHFPFFDWDKLTPQQVLDAFRRIRDEALLYCVGHGALPSDELISGVEKMYQAVPLLLDLALAGFEPSPKASVTSEKLLLTRFGKGRSGFFTIVNYTTSPQQCRFSADAMDRYHLIPADYDGHPLRSRITKSATQTDLTIKGRDYAALRKVAWAKGLPQAARIATSREDVAFKRRTWNFDVRLLDQPSAVQEWLFPVPRGYQPSAITVGQKRLDFDHGEGAVQCSFRPPRGDFAVRVVLTPRINVTGDLEDLYAIDFLGKASSAAIYVPQTYAEAPYNHSAWRIQEYFRYYSRQVFQQEPPVRLRIGTRNSLSKSEISIHLRPATGKQRAAGEIVIRRGAVIIKGDRETLPEAVLTFLNMLDEKYSYYGHFLTWTYSWVKESRIEPMAKKAGLVGKVLAGEIGDPLE